MRADPRRHRERDLRGRETLEILARELAALDAGIRVVAVRLEDVHSAPEAHTAFRDVASAMEDTKRAIRQAEGYRLMRLAAARIDGLVD